MFSDQASGVRRREPFVVKMVFYNHGDTESTKGHRESLIVIDSHCPSPAGADVQVWFSPSPAGAGSPLKGIAIKLMNIKTLIINKLNKLKVSN